MKKKNLGIIFLFIIIYFSINTISFAIIKGDYDNDSNLTAYDAYLVLKNSSNESINGEKLQAIDMDMDNKITSYDAYTILTQSISGAGAKNNSLDHTTLDVGQDVYVQHDADNQDLYLLSSDRGTTVYKLLSNIKYTAKKQWTQNGRYIDDFTDHNCATAPEDFVSVQPNEVYFVRLYGVGDLYTGPNGNLNEYTTPILFLDNNNNVIGDALSGTYANSTEGVEVTVPSGATRMHITNFNNQEISIQKKMVLSTQQFNELKEQQTQILNSLDSCYEGVANDPILYDKFDKCYIAFTIDDTREDFAEIANLFISKNIPLTIAAVSDHLTEMTADHTETKLDVALRVQEAGGEILANNETIVTAENIDNTEFAYKLFVGEKQKLTNYGFNVNGIVLDVGGRMLFDSPKTARWAYSLYKYSDICGEEYNNLEGYGSVYYGWRNWVDYYNNDVSQFNNFIDNFINMKESLIFGIQDDSTISIDTLSAVLDHINSEGINKIEGATYNSLYEKFAMRESEIIRREEERIEELNREKTYYVSSNGTSTNGTDVNDPINLDTLNDKEIKSGDTVLFKSGDIFYGVVDLRIDYKDDRKIKVSSYGTGDLPEIRACKMLGNGWEKYNDNIYRIDIKSNSNVTGLSYDFRNAYNIGFLEDDDGNKYYNKKLHLSDMSNQYDFYCDNEQYLYMYTNTNPYNSLGTLKAPTRINIFNLYSNMDISNLKVSYGGAHGMADGDSTVENVKISNCIIENIGGSYIDPDWEERYGNGIQFYECDAKNIEITNNIIRNIYDVGFTIQGSSGSGRDVFVHDNVFVSNCQDSEIWQDPPATGVVNYQFYNNVSINQLGGWGYDARPDKEYSGIILFWEYHIDPTDIYFHDNIYYNPNRVFFIEVTKGTLDFFKDNDYIKSDYNTYYLAPDAKILDTLYWDSYSVEEKDAFIETYHKDAHSKFYSITPDPNVGNVGLTSNCIAEIRTLAKIKSSEPLTGIEFEQSSYNIDNPGNVTVNVKPVPENAKIIPTYSKGLFVGNSLLWSFGNHGMASSSVDTDYYHFVHNTCLEKNPNYTDTKIEGFDFEASTTPAQSTAWINEELAPAMTADTDLVIIQLGDNCNTDEKIANLQYGLPQVFEYILSINPNCDIYWVGFWYNHYDLIDIITEACETYGATFIDISMLYDESTQAIVGDEYIDMYGNTQTITDGGDASHPSDAGMRLIADKIIDTIFAEKDAINGLNYRWTAQNEDILKIEKQNTGAGSNQISSNIQSGSSTLTVETIDSGITYNISTIVTVNNSEGTNTYSITINNPGWTHLPISQSRTLSITFDPSTAATGKTITWSSLNTNIATIDPSTGMVTAVSNGNAIIKAIDNNNVTNTYNINVSGTLGDIDNDSEITSYDAYRALQLSVDIEIGNDNSEDEIVTLDVDRDEDVTAWDAYRILMYSIGTIDSF